jgi:hypothetical protein
MLARALDSQVDLAKGTTTVMVAKTCTDRELLEFGTGGKISPPPTEVQRHRTAAGVRVEQKPNTDPWMARRIVEHLQSAPEALCILEDPMALPADPAVQAVENVAFVGDEVYRMIFPSDIGTEPGVERKLKQAKSRVMTGVLTTLRTDLRLLRGTKRLDEDDLLKAAGQTQAIFVSVYDSESYLLWERTLEIGA